MKLKEIEVGMVIHCKTQEQAWELVKHSNLPSHFASIHWNIYKRDTCYYHEGFPDKWSYSGKNYFIYQHFDIIEFEDLIIDERDTDYTLFSTKPVFDDYIICELVSGGSLDFGGMCNNVVSCPSEAGLLIFRMDAENNHLILASVPVSNIKCIKYIHSRESINKILEEINSERSE